MEQTELDAAKSRAFDAIARMVGMTHYPANEILHGVRAEIDMTVQKYGQPDTAPPPPTEAQEPQGLCYVLSEAARKCEVYPVMSRTYQHSSNLAVPWEQKRLAAETRVKDLETTVAGQNLYIASCHIGTDNNLNELATLRTRLERAEEALRQILEAYLNRNLSNSETFERMSNIAAAYFLPPSSDAVEAGGEEGGGA